jgi:putative ABC transport system substrate-binding protein
MILVGGACAGSTVTSSVRTRRYQIGYLAPRLEECEDADAWQIANGVAMKVGEARPASSGCQAATLVAALAERGYRQGETFDFIIAGAPTFGAANAASLLPPAEALVARGVDIILTVGPDAPIAAKKATSTIPIVAYRVGNFVENGIVANVARPGGNLTGVSLLDATGKYVELLRDAFPSVRHPIIVHAETPAQRSTTDREAQAAQTLGLLTTQIPWRLQQDSPFVADVEAAVGRGADSMVLRLGTTRPETIKTLIRKFRLPSVGGGLNFAESGYVLALSTPSQIDPWTAEYVDRILKGASPGDLPIVSTTALVVYVNLKLAAELGLTISPSVLSRASTVIRS